MTRAAIYARYSTQLQREASIEDQVRICRRLLKERGWAETQIYTDMGLSGASQLRPGYQKLLEDARAARFDAIVSESIDRISRDQEHVAAFHKQTVFAGIAVVTVAEGPINELHIGLKGTMSALYLKDLAQKTHRGLEGRIRAGKSAGGICYGYRLDRRPLPDGTFTTGDRVIDHEQAQTVRRIFHAYASGDSARTIAGRLNDEGTPGPRAKTWSFSTISGNWKRGTGILNNELYTGKLVWNRQRFIKDPVTGRRQARPNLPEEWVIEELPELRIVDQDLWERVKRRQGALRDALIQETGGNRPERARRPKYLFSGLLTCGCCGAGYTLMNKVKYGCSAARNKGTCTNRALIHREEVEDRVLVGLKNKLLDADLIAEFVAEYQREWNRLRQSDVQARAGLEREHRDVTRKIDQMIEAITDGMYHPAMKAKMTALEARKTQLDRKLAQVSEGEAPLRLHPGLAGVYRRKVADLTAALNAEDARSEAVEILRGLLLEIRPTPTPDGHEIELVGELASIMALEPGETTKPRLGAGASSETMVAGVGFEPTTFRL